MFRNPLTDVIVALVVVLLIFGPKRLPMLGRSLGQGLREFKDSITGESTHSDAEERPALTPAGPAEHPAADAGPEREPADVGSAEGRG
jgi:sec-independent protein translocase protein TatA